MLVSIGTLRLKEGDSIIIQQSAEIAVALYVKDGRLLIKGPVNNTQSTFEVAQAGIRRVREKEKTLWRRSWRLTRENLSE